MVDSFLGAVAANFLTVTMLYGLWRLTRNERDLGAIAICLAVLGSVVALAMN